MKRETIKYPQIEEIIEINRRLGEGNFMRKEFEQIINKNLSKWKNLNKYLATERLAKELIKARLKEKKRNLTN